MENDSRLTGRMRAEPIKKVRPENGTENDGHHTSAVPPELTANRRPLLCALYRELPGRPPLCGSSGQLQGDGLLLSAVRLAPSRTRFGRGMAKAALVIASEVL